MNIYFIGFRGVGKTSLLHSIAFPGEKIDLDEQLAIDFGEPILRFIQREGLDRFREREFAALSALEARDSRAITLIATGGGILDWAPSREFLAQSCSERVYLRAEPQLIWDRLKGHPERLVVGGIDSYEKFLALFEQRRPHYEALATKIIDHSSLEISRQEIERWLFALPGFMK